MFAVVRRCQWVCLLAWIMAPGWASAAIWQDLKGSDGAVSRGGEQQTVYYRALKADRSMLQQALATAPLERTASQGASIELPMPNGENQRFEVELSPVVSPALAAKYPDIQTYRVTGIDNPAISGRLDLSPAGFHALLTTPSGSVFIDPDADGNYRSFYKRDYASAYPDAASRHVCRMHELAQPAVSERPLAQPSAQRAVSTNARRIYRLAVVTTGEYGSYFNGETAATNHVISTINRVNQIYGRDLAVQLQLNHVIVYANGGSDPFSDPSNVSALLIKNQEVLDYAVGLDNYDIGHLFGVSDGGVAYLGSACTTSRAQGYTGHPTPDIGDPFDIDFVAHEIGHQLNAYHTFNGGTGSCGYGNRSAATAVEPGSGSTVMAYAGICGGENLASYSDATFHATSIGEINTFVFSGVGSQCGTLTSTSNTLPVTINAGSDVTIPLQTPFVLTGTVSSDPDGDSLSYQWDEIDVGGTATTASTIGTDLGDNPLFRSFVPKETPTRYFPRLSSLIAGTTDIGETLPTTASRTLNFRMTVRDGNSGVGDDTVRVTVGSQGPFEIDGGTLNSNSSFSGGITNATLNWNVVGTGTSCPTLSISLLSISSDGSTYCDKDDDARLSLQTGVTNDGVAAGISLPSVQIARARVMLKCENNVFFALSDIDFAVNSAANPIASNCKAIDGAPLEHGTVFVTHNIGAGDDGGGGGGGSLFLLPLLLALGGLLRRIAGDSAPG